MKRILPVLFAVLLFTQLGLHSGIWAYYWANTATVAAKHCENKAKPKLQCNGKCHMRKVTAQPESGPEALPRPDLKASAEPLVVADVAIAIPQPACCLTLLQTDPVQQPASPFARAVFHPPAFSC
jgi:hypothetical protein